MSSNSRKPHRKSRTGCARCKKRKIKVSKHASYTFHRWHLTHISECDERLPSCLHCEKAGRKCEGLTSTFKFVYQDQLPELREFSLPPLVFSKLRSVLRKQRRPHRSVKRYACFLDGDATISVNQDWSSHFGGPTSFPLSPAAELSLKLVKSLEATTGTGLTLLYLGEYFEELPAHIGQSECLDAAVEYLLLSQVSSYGALPFNPCHQLRKHGKALALLQNQLTIPEKQTCVETLCSALVLFGSEVCP